MTTELPPIIKQLAGLLQSRKFLLALIAFIGACVAFTQKTIDAETLVNATVVLVGALMATIAYEDGQAKSAGK